MTRSSAHRSAGTSSAVPTMARGMRLDLEDLDAETLAVQPPRHVRRRHIAAPYVSHRTPPCRCPRALTPASGRATRYHDVSGAPTHKACTGVRAIRKDYPYRGQLDRARRAAWAMSIRLLIVLMIDA
jgi:hypothetical protein